MFLIYYSSLLIKIKDIFKKKKEIINWFAKDFIDSINFLKIDKSSK